MAHRLACDLSDRFAAVVSFSGAGLDEASCSPSQPVSVLQVHGDADRAVRYQGGRVLGLPDPPPHPGAPQTVAAWAARYGCGKPQAGPALRIGQTPTERLRYPGCRGGVGVELWTVRGGGHLIGMRRADVDAALSFLLSHPRSPKP